MNKLKLYLKLARPHQYLKNVFVLAPLFFGHKLTDVEAISASLMTMLAFCLAASPVYVFNDLRDLPQDRRHPQKRRRPLASGAVSPVEASVFGAALLGLALIFAVVFLSKWTILILALYLALNASYSLYLKSVAIIDVVCVAIGFVLRVLAGGQAAQVPVSHWLVLMTFLLALFLALSKRRDDLILLENNINTRLSLSGYNMEFVSLSMVLMAGVIIVSYILYTVSPEVVSKHGTNLLYPTTFWVILGLLRYMQITFVEHKSGSPTHVFLKDVFLQVIGLLWVVNFVALLYVFKR